jgi:hypothetical protein
MNCRLVSLKGFLPWAEQAGADCIGVQEIRCLGEGARRAVLGPCALGDRLLVDVNKSQTADVRFTRSDEV